MLSAEVPGFNTQDPQPSVTSVPGHPITSSALCRILHPYDAHTCMKENIYTHEINKQNSLQKNFIVLTQN